MKKPLLWVSLLLLLCSGALSAQEQWRPAGDKIKTKWSETIDVNAVHSEYPRPIMERDQWQNLNGLWDYAVASVGSHAPSSYDGKILVPFCIESSLSGVGRRVTEKDEIWYNRSFTVPARWNGKNIRINFGAVDWKCDVWVNDVLVGDHTGGFTEFGFDITAALKKGANQLTVRVWDPTDKGYQPRGKQVSNPEGIWYTPVSGIWQTVWIEPVSKSFIERLHTTPDIDKRTLTVRALTCGNKADKIEVKLFDKGAFVAQGVAINGMPVEVAMPTDMKLWSPDSPSLYDMEVTLYNNGVVTDKVRSYAAMRKYSMKKDEKGIVRFQLNNKNLFHFGPLDQGWWCDGLFTAPCDEALAYDVKKTKDFGYNMIRKHIKVEPARWYTHCDRMGMIVWQDMPSGDKSPQWQNRNYFDGTEISRSKVSEDTFRKEWREIMDQLHSYPCIGVWVPFNEAWGQFKTVEFAEWTKNYDPTRLVNPASGGNHYPCGDMLDLHNYPHPEMYLYDASRANVLGEYGGIGLVLKDHLWEPNRNWGYVQFASSEEVTNEYEKYANQLLTLIERGFTGAVYTQTTDVEVEVNGLMTYDRKQIKIDEARVRAINQKICKSLK